MRNQRIDLFKCLAIYSVVFLHIKSGIPGWDWPVTGLTRFAVPYFFLVAGYFAYRLPEGKILRRAGHAFVLWALTLGLIIALSAASILRHPGWSVWSYVQDQFAKGWKLLLAVQIMPFPYAHHGWFIGALPILYLIWWGVTRGFCRMGREIPYRALAVMALMMLELHLVLGEGLSILGRGSVAPQYLRNAWLDGLPFFLLGAWAHYDEEGIKAVLRKGHVPGGILLGSCLTLVEQRMAGYQDLFLGSALTAFLLLAAAIKWPEVKQNPVTRWICACGGRMTFAIYAIHVPLYGLFEEWNYVPLFGWILAHQPIVPLTVALFSTAAAVLLDRGRALVFRKSAAAKRGENGNKR